MAHFASVQRNRETAKKKALTTLATLTIAFPAFPAIAEEEEIPLNEAPEVALATAQANAQGREFDTVLRQVEDGVLMYEFVGTKADGLGFAVEVFADGTLWETAEEIAMDQVPPAAAAVFGAELPGFVPEIIEKNTRDGGALIVYEFEGELNGEAIEAEVHEDGSNFAIEDEAG
ncbi:MAG: hypothetical protein AAGA95_16940 [Pseudomonadota bacterium]